MVAVRLQLVAVEILFPHFKAAASGCFLLHTDELVNFVRFQLSDLDSLLLRAVGRPAGLLIHFLQHLFVGLILQIHGENPADHRESGIIGRESLVLKTQFLKRLHDIAVVISSLDRIAVHIPFQIIHVGIDHHVHDLPAGKVLLQFLSKKTQGFRVTVIAEKTALGMAEPVYFHDRDIGQRGSGNDSAVFLHACILRFPAVHFLQFDCFPGIQKSAQFGCFLKPCVFFFLKQTELFHNNHLRRLLHYI